MLFDCLVDTCMFLFLHFLFRALGVEKGKRKVKKGKVFFIFFLGGGGGREPWSIHAYLPVLAEYIYISLYILSIYI